MPQQQQQQQLDFPEDRGHCVDVPDPNSAKKRQVSQSTSQEQSLEYHRSKQSRTDNQLQNTTDSSPVASESPISPRSNEVKKVSCEDIQMVQNLIERCLQLYMNQSEVVNTLMNQAKVEPGFTSLVWQKLEEQNADFFRAYFIRLKLKQQILIFNHLLEQHLLLLQKLCLLSPTTVPVQTFPRTDANSVNESYFGGGFQSACSTSRVNSTVETSSSISPTISSCAAFPFGTVESPLDLSSATMCLKTSVPLETPFSGGETQTQVGMIDLPIGATDSQSSSTPEVLGSLGQLPRNFSLSDLTPELGNTSD